MRTQQEIHELRREAKALVEESRRRARLAVMAERKAFELHRTIEALIHYRAAELGVGPDELGDHDVYVSDEERGLKRLFMLWNIEAAIKPTIAENESFERIVARLALDRGWTMMDATRAILRSTDDTIDLRDSSARAIVRRVQTAIDAALEVQLGRIERHLAALDSGRPSEAAGTLLIGALFMLASGKEIVPDDIRSALLNEKRRLGELLSQRKRSSRVTER